MALLIIPYVSIVTSKLALVLLLLYILIVAISYPTLCISIGTFLNNKTKKPSKAKGFGFTLLISTALWVLQLIPFAGSIFTILAVVIGFGMILIGSVKRKEKLEEN